MSAQAHNGFSHAAYDRDTGERLLAVDVEDFEDTDQVEDGLQVWVTVDPDAGVRLLESRSPDVINGTGERYFGHLRVARGKRTRLTFYTDLAYICLCFRRDNKGRLSYAVTVGSYRMLYLTRVRGRQVNRARLGRRHGADFADFDNQPRVVN